MGRNRSPNREKAFELFKESIGEITSKEIAEILNEKICNINSWRIADKWKDRLKNKVGALYCNKNSVGNNGGAPQGNQNSRKFGFFSKYLPKEVIDITEFTMNMNPLDILWSNIQLKYAAIIRAQKIMYVTDKDEMIKEVKKHKEYNKTHEKKTGAVDEENSIETEWEFQFAWDRQATFLNAQSRAMAQLTNMLKRYDEMLHENWDTVTEEQRLRVEKMRVNIDMTKEDIKNRKDIADKKLQLEKERFEHQKEMDEKNNW